jgi:hypothetical protein
MMANVFWAAAGFANGKKKQVSWDTCFEMIQPAEQP